MTLWTPTQRRAMGAICEALVAPKKARLVAIQHGLYQWSAEDSRLISPYRRGIYELIASEEEQRDLRSIAKIALSAVYSMA